MPPPITPPLLAKAFQLHQAGSLAEAAALYQAFLRERPDDPAALNNLGALQLQTGAAAAAVETLSAFVALRPNYAIGQSNLGHALMQAGRAAEAEAPLRRAVALAPDFAQAHNHLGMALAILDRSEEAAAAFSRALVLEPTLVEAARNLGQTLNDAGDGEGAAAAYRVWLRADPANTRARAGLALAEAMQGRLGEAITALERLTQEHPDDWEVWQTLGLIRQWDGQFIEAEIAARRVLALHPNPDSSEAPFLVAGSLLGRGDYRNGWRAFERRPLGVFGESMRYPGLRFPDLPLWDGKALAGRLLLHGEQGLGDVIQFSRFIPRVMGLASSNVLLLDKHWASLAPLLASLPGVDAILTDPAELAGAGAPPIAARASILSLPYLLGTEVETIPNEVPYLRAAPDKVAAWAQRLAGMQALRVGIAWTTYARPRMAYVTRQRTVPLALIARLLNVPGTAFVSLQKGRAANAAQDPLLEGRLNDVSAELQDFGDTAALIENLDLVISVDTAVVHVAGALGKPVWMLDRYNACWRWCLSATDSPWYPRMRIFRQSRLGEWESVINDVSLALAERARSVPSSFDT